MYNSYLFIVTHPLFLLFLGGTAVFFLLQSVTAREAGSVTGHDRAWIARNYVWVIIGVAAVLALLAMGFYLIEISISLTALVDRLRDATDRETTKPEDLRNLAYAIAALLGVLAASATLVFSLLRVWINERQTSASEQGLITDRINKAVEALGAEKTVTRLGRTLFYTLDGVQHRVFEWQDAPQELPEGAEIRAEKTSDWQPIGLTEPNLEVRIGAILALERISQDSLRDHIQVMEILTAYLRQNLSGFVPPDMPTEEARYDTWQAWRNDNPPQTLRIDFNTIFEVIKRRTIKAKKHEKQQVPPYRINLSHIQACNLDLSQVNLEYADLSYSDLTGALLAEAKVNGAKLDHASMHRTDFYRAMMKGIRAYHGNLRFARLHNAHLERSKLLSADFSGAMLWNTALNQASLQYAKLKATSLLSADLQGANLSWAKMQMADLRLTKFDKSTLFSQTELWGVYVENTDLSLTPQISEHVESMFGVNEVLLPSGVNRPKHWITTSQHEDYQSQFIATQITWHKWLRSLPDYDGPYPSLDP